MKKILVLLLSAILLITIVGCGGESNEAKETEIGMETKQEEVEQVDETKEEGPITIEQVPYQIEILEPNSIGTVYMNATYTNNTEYPITSIEMKVLRKDENETGYLTNHDTVMPGESSPVFDAFGPSTTREEDYEILTITIRAETEEGNTLVTEYDTKLDKYKYSEY